MLEGQTILPRLRELHFRLRLVKTTFVVSKKNGLLWHQQEGFDQQCVGLRGQSA